MNIVRMKDAHGDIRNGTMKSCEFCNKEFFTRLDQQKRFCSSTCSSMSRRKRTQVECDTCGSNIEIVPKRYNHSKHKKFFCSIDCKLAAQRIGGSIAPSHYGKSDRCNYRDFFESEELCCSRCGYEEFKCGVDIHHKNEDRSDNRKENLLPLCSPCHRALHLGFWKLQLVTKL